MSEKVPEIPRTIFDLITVESVVPAPFMSAITKNLLLAKRGVIVTDRPETSIQTAPGVPAKVSVLATDTTCKIVP
jgi:hypothetical protein